jgi:hypothetical protein
MADPLMGRRGVLLPMALLGLLALTALAIMTHALVHGMVVDGTLERRYLEGWAAAEPAERQMLSAGFELTRHEWTSAGQAGRSGYSVVRVLDPYLDSRRWGAAIYAPMVVGVDRVEWASLPCGGASRAESRAGPLLNFHGALVERLAPEPMDSASIEGILPEPSGVMHLYHINGISWLFSEGDIELRGDGVGRGVLLSLGAVTIRGGVRWEGGIAARGSVRIEEGARVVGDWCALEEAIAVIDEPRHLDLPGGDALGRY